MAKKIGSGGGLDWIKTHYKLPAEVNKDTKILFGDSPGKVIGSKGQYLEIKFKDGSTGLVHPVLAMKYYINDKWIDMDKKEK